jgi:LPXTG-motif cell wall-anchored protein
MSSVRPARVVLLRLVVLATILALVFAALSSAAVANEATMTAQQGTAQKQPPAPGLIEVPTAVPLPLPTPGGGNPGGGNGQTTLSFMCGSQEYVIEPSRQYFCLIFRKIWLDAEDNLASLPPNASVSLRISLNGQLLGSLECTATRCEPLFVFLDSFNPATAVFDIEEVEPPPGWQLHPVYQNGATFDELRDPPGETESPPCSVPPWPRSATPPWTECELQIANKAVSSPGDGNGDTGGGNGQTTPSYTCGGTEYVLEHSGQYYCLDFRKIWLNADDLVTSPHLDVDASVSLRISLNGQFLGSFECTATGCTQLVVFLANFDPDTAVFHIEENGLPQGWRLHPDHRDGATFRVLQNPPGQGPGPACRITSWLNYPGYYVTECLLVIANQQEASTGGTGEDNSGGGGGTGVGGGGSTGGASTAPGTSSVPASEAASPRSDAQPAGSSEALAPQQPATEPSPASAAASPMPPLPQVLPRTGQPQALTSLAGIGLVLLGCGVILLRRPARAR